MMLPVLFAATTIASFFALAHMAVRTTPRAFRLASMVMLWTGLLLASASMTAGAGVIAAVLLGRRLGPERVPATVPAWFSQQI